MVRRRLGEHHDGGGAIGQARRIARDEETGFECAVNEARITKHAACGVGIDREIGPRGSAEPRKDARRIGRLIVRRKLLDA